MTIANDRNAATPPARVRQCATIALLFVLAAGCSNEPSWNTTPLPAEHPNLELDLVGESGQPLDETAFAGQSVILVFGYTHCPDVCPTTLAKLEAALKQANEAVAERTRVLFVSVDPERDTPERLAQYTSAFGAHVIGATGSPSALETLAHRYGTSFQRRESDGAGHYFVDHASNILVFDGTGQARLRLRPDASVQAIAEDLERLASPNSA